MNILHAYNPDVRPEDQVETQEFISGLMNHTIYSFRVGKDDRYEQAFRYMWEKHEPFIIIEQDIVPTQQDIDNLASCPHPLCASNYKLYPASTGLPDPVLAHRIAVYNNVQKTILLQTRWVNYTDQFCDLFGFGLTKITPDTDKYPIKFDRWNDLDSRISKYFWHKLKRCHIHNEVRHNHRVK